MDQILAFLRESGLAVYDALRALLVPALVFFLIGLAVKRRALFADMRRAAGQSSLNLQIIAFNALVTVPAIGLLAVGVHALWDAAGLALLSAEDWAAAPAWPVILLAVFIGDFTGYWRHRFEHTPILWPSHAVHHSDDEMTWLTLERFHPVNRLTTFLIDNSVLLLLGFPPWALAANNFVRHWYGYLIHADLPWTYGPLARVFVSPAMHRWHHAAVPEYFQANFATVFSVFDRAFGTYKVPGPCTAPLGVTDDMEASLAGQMGYMFHPRAYKRLRDGSASVFRWR